MNIPLSPQFLGQLFFCSSFNRFIANGEGLHFPFSQRLTVENVIPILAASCSCVRLRVVRSFFIILGTSLFTIKHDLDKKHYNSMTYCILGWVYLPENNFSGALSLFGFERASITILPFSHCFLVSCNFI